MTTYSLSAKSLVLTLNNGSRVYYKIDTNQTPRMTMQGQTFTLNGETFEFEEIRSFRISTTDYSGESGTREGATSIISIKGDIIALPDSWILYNIHGQQLGQGSESLDLSDYPEGTYLISYGTQTLKIKKQ